MKTMIKNMARCGLILWSGQVAMAQTDYETDGEVQDAEIVIEKERKIELNKETKLYEFIKWQPERTAPIMKPSEFKWYLYDVANEPMQFEPAKAMVKQENESYQHYGKAGFGNYGSPLLDVSLTTAQDPNLMAGVNVKHESFAKGEVDDENSAGSASEINLYGAMIREAVKLESGLNYRLENNYYYGYPVGTVVDKSDVKHSANFFNLSASAAQRESEDPLAWQGKIGFNHYSDNFEAKENTLSLGLGANYGESFYFDTELNLSSYQDTGIDESRSYLRLNPYYRLVVDELTLDVGLSFSWQNDDLPNLNATKVFPFARASYDLSVDYTLFAQLDGGFTFNSLSDFASNTGVLNQSIGLANSERLFDLSGGISGSPMEQLSVRAEVGLQAVNYLPILVNNATDQSRIDVAYDLETSNVFTLKGKAQYEINKQHHLSAGVNFYGYSSDGYDQIYHRPTSEILLSGDHEVVADLSARWNFTFLDGIVGQNLALTDTDVALDAIPKLDLSLHYQLKKEWGLFLSGENLLNKNYSRYLHYPQRGIQIKAGLTFRL